MGLETGEVINNRYRIVKILGQGGFGAVYRAWDTSFNMPCALKENLETTPQAQRQFEREARMLRTMKHANLPLVADYFIIPGKGQYLIMDFIDGQDVEHLLEEKGGALPIEEVLNWIGQICDALDYMHLQNPPVIHRDIKPANIRITPQGQAILVDFGIAKSHDPSLKTSTGARALTPGYAPIEQYGQGKTDARTDIYALGATAYTMLTGERPLESVQRTVEDTLKPINLINPTLSEALAQDISKAMSIDPNKRYSTALAFKHALMNLDHAKDSDDGLLTATVVAPMPEQVSPFEQPAISIAPTPISIPQSSKSIQWGIMSGVGITILVIVLLFFSASGVFIYNQFIKADTPTPTTVQMTNIPEDDLPQTTPESTLPLILTNAPETAENLPTSTYFTSVEKPEDLPIMPGAEDVKVLQQSYVEGVTNINVFFFATASTIEAIVAYYEAEMPKYGWTEWDTFSDEEKIIIQFIKDDESAVVMITTYSGKLYVQVGKTFKE
jgi:eukaryotic-like serine/threonine-protein kinase